MEKYIMAELINIKFPDGKSTKIEKGLNGHDIAKQISMSLSKAAIAFKVNGEILDLSRTIEDDSEIQILTKEDNLEYESLKRSNISFDLFKTSEVFVKVTSCRLFLCFTTSLICL